MSDISTFLGIFEDESEDTQIPEGKPLAALNKEEEFFLQQIKDLKVKRILPKFTPDGIAYSELASLLTYYDSDQMRALLESLAQKGYIKKINYGTVALCPSCYSPVVMIVLSCPRCGSMKITKREVIKHRACGYTGYAEDYFDGIDCRCPLCGAEYDPSGFLDPNAEDEAGFTVAESMYECDSCGSASGKPSVTYNCIKCKTKFQSKDICFENPKGYEMIDPGEAAQLDKTRRDEIHLAIEDDLAETDKAEAEIVRLDNFKGKSTEEEQEPRGFPEEPSIEEPDPMLYTDETAYMEGEAEDFQLWDGEPDEAPEADEPEAMKEEPEEPPEPKTEEKLLGPETEEEEPEKKKGLFGGLFYKKEKKKKPRPVEKKPMSVQREVVRRNETSILLIEQDEEKARKILERLERTRLQNVEVRHAFTGRLGLRELRREHDAVILDAELDDIDPKLILLEMARWNIETPIIVICGDPVKLKSYSGYKLSRAEFLDPSEDSMDHISMIINELLA